MSIFDIVLMIIIGIGTIYGITKGFIQDIFSLLALIVGVIAAIIGYHWGAVYLAGLITPGPIADLVAFAVIFLAVSIGLSALGVIISKAIVNTNLSIYDRIAGGFFGFAKGLIVASVIAVIGVALVPSAVTSSKIAPHLLRGFDAAAAVLPKDIKKQIDTSRNILKTMHDETAPLTEGEDKGEDKK